MNEPQPEPVPVTRWEFDNFDVPKSWVELADAQYGQQVTIFANSEAKLKIVADKDQWGTWITFQIGDEGFTIGQEDGTKSFIDALIASLVKLKGITDFDTEPPVVTELKPSDWQRTD